MPAVKKTVRQKTHLTPPVVAEQLGCNVGSVLAWIHAKQLRAVNLGNASRPRWRIDVEDLRAFLDSRATVPASTR